MNIMHCHQSQSTFFKQFNQFRLHQYQYLNKHINFYKFKHLIVCFIEVTRQNYCFTKAAGNCQLQICSEKHSHSPFEAFIFVEVSSVAPELLYQRIITTLYHRIFMVPSA